MRIGGRWQDHPKVAELHKAGLNGIPIHNNYLAVHMFFPETS